VKRSAALVFVVAVTSICSGQWLERQVVIGDTLGGISLTGGIVVNPISGNVYIESDPIQLFNPVTMEKMRGPGALGMVVFCPASGKGYILGDSAVIIDAAADTVIGARALPRFPSVFAYNPTLNRLYIGSTSRETLYVFDPDGDSVLHTVGVGAAARCLLWDSAWNRVYVGTDSDQLKVIDCTADTLLAEIPLGIDHVSTLALSTASHKLYCAGDPDTTLVVVSTDSLRTVGVVRGVTQPDTMVYNPLANRLYCPLGDTMLVIDCGGDTVRTRLETPALSLAVSTLSGKAYLGRSDSAQVLVMDTNDLVVDSIPLPTVPTHYIAALGFWPDRNELYGVTIRDLAFVVDASVDTVAGGVSYAAYQPRQMVHNPAGNKLYMLCPGHDEILVLDSTFGTPKHILGGAVVSDAMPVLNQALNRLYVADYQALRVIECSSDSLLESRAMHGISHPRPVMVPYLNKLYVFEGSGGADSVYAYDCLRDTVVSILYLSDAVPCAVYDPRSNRVFFACEDAPTVRALDPVTDAVVSTFDLVGGSAHGKMALNLDLGRLYYVDQSPDMIFTIDVLTDSVISSESLRGNVDTMFLNRRLGKLYLCQRSQTWVFDCRQNTVVDTIYAGYRYAGLMNDRNDKLYLRHGAVVDCRYDSVIAMLPPDSLSPRSMAWDAIDNRVFQATTSRLYVYRDDPYGVEEQKVGNVGPLLAVLGNPVRNAVRLRLQIPQGQTGRLTFYDVTGRLAHSTAVTQTSTFRINLGSVPAGVYFVALETGRTRITDKVIVKH
jgi:DNA-binding beta-propeller fold protein YncE